MEGKEAQEQAGRRSKEGKGRSERGQLRKCSKEILYKKGLEMYNWCRYPGT